MKTKITLFSVLILVSTNCFSQTQTLVSEVWTEDKGSQNFFQKNVTVTDAYRNVYIAGATLNGNGNYDLLLTKYDKQGTEIWTQQVNGNGNGDDFATAVFVDASLNVYVTGTEYESSTNKNDIIVQEYNSSGTLQWSTTYNGTSSDNDAGGDIVVDGLGNVYVTGATYDNSNQYDFVTIKYNSSGSQQWVSQWDNVGLNDAAIKITYNGKVYVAGGTQVGVIKWEYAIVEYDPSNGSQVGYSISGGSSTTGIDKVTDITRDAIGNVYVTGGAVNASAGYDCYTLKLDSSLNTVWTATYDGGDNLDDVANSVDVDSQGNVYICGYTTKSGEGKNYVTIKYNSSGSQQWVKTFNRINGDDEATALALKSGAEIIVTGTSSNGGNDDYFTIKYTDNGDEVWNIAYDAGMNDKASDIAIDNLGGIIVAGQSETSGAMEYVTVKYEEIEAIIPPDSIAPLSSLAFYQNRGQLINTNNVITKEEKYYTFSHYPGLYFYKPQEQDRKVISYLFSRIDTIISTPDTLHKVDLTFERDWKYEVPVSLETQPVATDKNNQGYLNYFLPQCPRGITYVEGFNKLYYPSVFDNTDVLFYNNNAGMKFYIIIKPGAEPDVNLKFTGQDNLVITDASLEIVTSIGSYTYPRPEVFQIDANGDRQAVSFTPAYVDWGNGRVGFTLGSYDTGLPLVIEIGQTEQAAASVIPGNLDWSTYMGGNADDYFGHVHTDATGNIYLVGGTNSTSFPIPVTWGQFSTFAGYKDAMVVKFDPNGQAIMRTYYGGTGQDYGRTIDVDANSNIYFAGVTDSPILPSSSATATLPNGDSLSGAFDYYLVKLDLLGFVQWSHFVGGSGQEGDTYVDIGIAPDGKLYMGGQTESTDFPYIASPWPTAYNQSTNHGDRDVVLLKFELTGALDWSTYFGGPFPDIFLDLEVKKPIADFNSRILITGATASRLNASSNPLNPPCHEPTQPGNYFPDCNPGGNAYHQQYMGNDSVPQPGHDEDAFIAEFSNNGDLLWSTMFGGHGEDIGQKIKMDGLQNLYFIGTYYTSCDSFPLMNYPGGYNQTFCNNSLFAPSSFVAKFRDRQLIYCSFLEGTPLTVAYSLACDNANENFFVTGVTQVPYYALSCAPPTVDSTTTICNYNSLFFEQDYFNHGSYDGFVMGFNKNLQVFWSSYFGGYGYDVTWDANVFNGSPEKLYLAGYSTGYNYSTANFDSSYPYVHAPPPTYDQPYNASTPLLNLDAVISRFTLPVDVGVHENAQDIFEIVVYPNPATDEITIILPELTRKDIKFNLVDVLGRTVMSKKLERGKNTYRISISSISDGLYFANVIMENKIYTAKIIKHD